MHSFGRRAKRGRTSSLLHHRRTELGSYADFVDTVNNLFLNQLEQVLEQAVRFIFILNQRVALAVGAQTNTGPQMVDRLEVFDPEHVDAAQHNPPLDFAHRRFVVSGGDNLIFQSVVGFNRQLEQVADNFAAATPVGEVVAGFALDIGKLQPGFGGERKDGVRYLVNFFNIPERLVIAGGVK